MLREVGVAGAVSQRCMLSGEAGVLANTGCAFDVVTFSNKAQSWAQGTDGTQRFATSMEGVNPRALLVERTMSWGNRDNSPFSAERAGRQAGAFQQPVAALNAARTQHSAKTARAVRPATAAPFTRKWSPRSNSGTGAVSTTFPPRSVHVVGPASDGREARSQQLDGTFSPYLSSHDAPSPSAQAEGHGEPTAPARASLLQAPDATNTAAALEWLEAWLLRAGGSTRLMPALETAMRYAPDPRVSPSAVLFQRAQQQRSA